MPTWDALRRFTGEQDVLRHDAGPGRPTSKRTPASYGPPWPPSTRKNRHGSQAKTATNRAQQEEAERRRTEYADEAVSAKYKLRYLRRRHPRRRRHPTRPATRTRTTSTRTNRSPTPPRRNAFEGLHPPPLLLPRPRDRQAARQEVPQALQPQARLVLHTPGAPAPRRRHPPLLQPRRLRDPQGRAGRPRPRTRPPRHSRTRTTPTASTAIADVAGAGRRSRRLRCPTSRRPAGGSGRAWT